MSHLDPASSAAKAKDPVCGMDVNPATARHKTQHNGEEYLFCSAGCLSKFRASPEKILASPPKPMGSGLVSLGSPTLSSPTLGTPSLTRPAAASTVPLPRESGKAKRAYVCPMCPEVRQIGPGPCPKCGMALDPESPALPASKTEYTCPMHPEIVR